LKEEFLIGLRLGVAAEDEGTAVGGREVGIDHLDGGELVEHGSRGESWSVGPQAGTEGDMKAIGQERDDLPISRSDSVTIKARNPAWDQAQTMGVSLYVPLHSTLATRGIEECSGQKLGLYELRSTMTSGLGI